MILLLPVTAALLVSAQIPLSMQLELPTGDVAELSADELVVENGFQSLSARGHTVMRTGELLLRADELSYDQTQERAVARGNVMLVRGLFAAVADEISVDIKSFEANVKGGVFMQKKNVSVEQLLATKTPKELREIGETPVIITGTRIRRTGANGFAVDDLAFTPCECDPKEPSWRVEAKRAKVEVGERAILSWPVVYVYSVPVFALPWLYLPLSERRSGVLVPKITKTALNGPQLEQPFFLTLGRSYDLTLTPGFYLGSSARDVDPNPDVDRREPNLVGVRGPRLHTEFRYVPSERTSGRLSLGLIDDSRPRRDPLAFAFFRDADGRIVQAQRGLRGEASLQHVQDLGGGFHDRVDASFVSDGYYTRDLIADIIAREVGYLRSTGVAYHRDDDHYLGLDISLRQDLRNGYSFLGTDRYPAGIAELPNGPRAGDVIIQPGTLHRLPALTWALPERALGRVLSGSLRVEFSRLSPLTSSFDDAGENGLVDERGIYLVRDAPDAPPRIVTDTLQANGRYDGADRESRDRLDLFPRLSGSWALGPYLRLTPSLAVRQDLAFGELTGRFAQRGYPLAGVVLDSELARTYDWKHKALFRHVVAPRVELRMVPLTWGGLLGTGRSVAGRAPGTVYDEIDAALPRASDPRAPGFLHAVVEVDQRLFHRRDGATQEVLRLDLGQGFDLSSLADRVLQSDAPAEGSRLRDTYARLSAQSGPFRATGIARYDLPSGQFTQISGNVTIDNGKGELLFAQYDDLVNVGSDALRRGIDALVGPPATSTARARQLFTGARLTMGIGLGLRYEAIVQPLDPKNVLAQQVFGLSYGPACDCWRLEGVLIKRRDVPGLDFGANFTIARFGSFGT
ncbi:LPS assembly protein LptD [Aggregicoccus sp. 17bor-14]|uniref:LPS-assembly protein LptD n=1 Tax=Myxococcaceae TaxID=31 RepID=UPI00129C3E8D|nr:MULTISPECIES: LPS assembly protein LptD [Myxococcaceae]MBF5041383.1 LPS assembly protein LptD [Simulacricoccus sp. 17bor-14]MRI87167.1 LPS assembly protein LptD [Aggregicoccus sp. 17bor-14]